MPKTRLAFSFPRFSHSFLLATLLLLLALRPIADTVVFRFPILNLLLTLVLVAGVATASQSRVYLTLALCLALPSFALRWAVDHWYHPVAVTAHLSLTAAFVALTLVAVFVSVLRAREVSADTVVGGIAVYMMIGVGFATLYTLTEHVAPGSLTGPGIAELPVGDEQLLFSRMLYYSFVTLTTLGYGDIIPVGEVVRNLASAEAVLGQLFIAIFIARLVGLHITQASEHSG